MSGFNFPTNIKQIGSIGEGLRIYIEDYAYSYLQQYIDSSGSDAKLAFLVGRSMVIDSQDVLFISGVVRGLHTEFENGVLTFTKKSFENAKKEISRYFEGLEIVGWMQSQPGFGLRLSPVVTDYHLKTFTGKTNVCLIMDFEDKQYAFYFRNGEESELVEAKGYFVYYDKNRGMHEYMIDNKQSKIKVISAQGKRDNDKEHGQGRVDDIDTRGMPSGEAAVARIKRNYTKEKIKPRHKEIGRAHV